MEYEMHPLARLAKSAVEGYVKSHEFFRAKELSPEMKEHAGVFVSIHKRGQLRGCIGTFEPTQTNVAEEVVQNAISAAVRDPRFNPIKPSELDDLDYSVDVLTPPERVASPAELDPKKYGLIVQCGYKRGLLLPDLEGVEDVQTQINICCQSATSRRLVAIASVICYGIYQIGPVSRTLRLKAVAISGCREESRRSSYETSGHRHRRLRQQHRCRIRSTQQQSQGRNRR
jgi:AmmeMemoRadiSam system protein A